MIGERGDRNALFRHFGGPKKIGTTRRFTIVLSHMSSGVSNGLLSVSTAFGVHKLRCTLRAGTRVFAKATGMPVS